LRRRGLLSPKLAARVNNHWTRNMVAEIVFSPEYSGIHLNYHTISEYEERINPLTGIAGRRKRILLLRKSTRDYLPLDTLLDQYGEYAVSVPAIVDPATHLVTQYRFLARRTGPRGDAQDALLRAGHVFCGYCKNPMAVRRSKANPSQTEYFCSHTKQTAWTVKPDCPVPSNQMYVARLDAAVWVRITEALKKPEVLVALLTRAHEVVGLQTDRIVNLRDGAQRDLDTARAEMAALVEQSTQPNIHPAAR
jgi:Recombinase zinc beta ribbon domain